MIDCCLAYPAEMGMSVCTNTDCADVYGRSFVLCNAPGRSGRETRKLRFMGPRVSRDAENV